MYCFFHDLTPVIAACLAALALAPTAAGDEKKEVSFVTPDGLRLFGTWYEADRNACTVIMLHAYGPKENSAKGEWQALAKALNEMGFAVLTFDFRGHGRSAAARTFDDKKLFCDLTRSPHNQFAGLPLHRDTLDGMSVKDFQAGYCPYLVYDIAGARRFVDTASDDGECNSSRLFLVGDREMCSLGMLWMGLEFFRQGVNAPPGSSDAPPKHLGSRDLVGAVWLSPRTPPSMAGVITRLFNQRDIANEVANTFSDEIGMAFVYGDEDAESKATAQGWFRNFQITRPDAMEDKDKRKYKVEVKGAKKLEGVGLLAPALGADKQILEFMRQTKKRSIIGPSNIVRNPSAAPVVLALDKFGLLKP